MHRFTQWLRFMAVGLAATFTLVSAVSATSAAPLCGAPTVTDLRAGQTVDAGDVSVANDSANVYVTFTTNGGWVLTETHVAMVTSSTLFPVTKTGNPKIGNFPYKTTHAPAVTTYTYTFDRSVLAAALGLSSLDAGTTLFVAAHAVVQLPNAGGTVQQETGWGQGTPFPGGSWAMYFQYVVQRCEVSPIAAGQFRTQTQGGWGTACRGGNPGCYRDANFASAFPGGLVIGSLNTLTLTSSAAIEGFLPQGGTPGPLTQGHIDPSSTEAGVLAGQLVAATLSAAFDLRDPAFGASSTNLLDLRVIDPTSACYGWTVEDVLAGGNQILGGEAGSLTASQINACLTLVNEAFVDGTTVSGKLGY